MTSHTAAVIGSGPNGLAAAVVLARAGIRTTVYEAADSIGGGARTAELTVPGYRHDMGSAVHPLAVSSGFFRRFELGKRIELVTPEISYAHPLDDRPAAIAYRDLRHTAEQLGVDGQAWHRLFAPLVDRAQKVAQFTGLVTAARPPRIRSRRPSSGCARSSRAVWPGTCDGETLQRLRCSRGWLRTRCGRCRRSRPRARPSLSPRRPMPAGGRFRSAAVRPSSMLSADDLRAHGGSIETGVEITTIAQVGPVDAVLLDTTPRALVRLTGDALPSSYRARMLAIATATASRRSTSR